MEERKEKRVRKRSKEGRCFLFLLFSSQELKNDKGEKKVWKECKSEKEIKEKKRVGKREIGKENNIDRQ